MSFFKKDKKEFDYVIVGVGENYKQALENAEHRLPAPLNNTETYAQVKVGEPIDCGCGSVKVEIMYNLKGKPLEQTAAERKLASADTKNLFELLNE